jgi:hypothetical protein
MVVRFVVGARDQTFRGLPKSERENPSEGTNSEDGKSWALVKVDENPQDGPNYDESAKFGVRRRMNDCERI